MERSQPTMQSLSLQGALSEYVESAAVHLREEVAAGAEVPFEVDSHTSGRALAGTRLYCYRALSGAFIAQRRAALEQLPAHAQAARLLDSFDGLDRYLAAFAGEAPRGAGPAGRTGMALVALLQDVFAEQTDFELRSERLEAALERLECAALASAGELTLIATLHGLMIASPEMALTQGLTLAQPDALAGLPDGAQEQAGAAGVTVVLGVPEPIEDPQDPAQALAQGRAMLAELLRALRLFGDGRVALGPLAWARRGTGAWSPLAVGGRARPRGMLLVSTEQEDELRAFCNLVSRRVPNGEELAWALQRYELGCERDRAYEALSDHLLALRALLEPEGPASGLLAGRLAALCATRERRLRLTERVLKALALERAVIAGTAVEHAAGEALADEIAENLRALLRDVICGHLDPDLVGLADELLLEPEQPSGEEGVGDAAESEEILDIFV